MAAGGLTDLIPYAVNFTAVAGAAVYFGRKPIQRFVYQRHERQKDLMGSARRAKEEADKRFAEIQQALEAFPAKKAKLIEEQKQRAEKDAAELKAKAEQEKARIKSDADHVITNERHQRESEIRDNVLSLAIAQTETKLRSELRSEDHNALISAARSTIAAGGFDG